VYDDGSIWMLVIGLTHAGSGFYKETERKGE